MSVLRIATRNSPLALWQTNFVKEQLLSAHPDLRIEIIGMTTRGDELLDQSLATKGGKGLFLKELQSSLLDGTTDIAVHSMKDVPVETHEGLEITALCKRDDPRDAFVSNEYQNLYALSEGARVGTSSLRRVIQLKNTFPKLEFVELRGNVNTRLSKLDNGDYDAIILAAAGLIRLGLENRINQYISPELCLPAVGQGIIGIECRTTDLATKSLLRPIHSKESEILITAERAMNTKLEGGCQLPVAGHAQIARGQIRLRGCVGSISTNKLIFAEKRLSGLSADVAEKLGAQIGNDLIQRGASSFINEVGNQPSIISKAKKSKVLLTRQKAYLGNCESILTSLDFQPCHVQCVQIQPNYHKEMLSLFEQIDHFSDVVFVSRNAAEIGMQIINQNGGLPNNVRPMAVGAETAKHLYRLGVDAVFPEKGYGAQALLNVNQFADLTGRRLLIVRGEIGLDWPAEEMRKRGGEVAEAKCYTQTIPSDIHARLDETLNLPGRLDGIFIHSTQSLINLLEVAGLHTVSIKNTKLVVGSKRIARYAQLQGWIGEIRVADSPSNKHMMISFSG